MLYLKNFAKTSDNIKMPKPTINLQPHQEELIQLAELAGIHADPNIFRIIIEMLNMQIDHQNIFNLLKLIRKSSKAQAHKMSTKPT